MAKSLDVDTLKHTQAKRLNIPTAEFESVLDVQTKAPVRVAYERRNRDLDPQLVWRGKDEQDWSDLVVPAPPLYIQEKVQPKALIDDLQRRTKAKAEAKSDAPDLFADFDGVTDKEAVTEFYAHEQHWANRMILGDGLQVMASLAEREGLRGKVQCIYIDPPYGIKFNSNFQWSTTSRDVKDGAKDHVTREPEQVKAFRDTWRDGIHSYLTYLRDRLTVARDLLRESGSVFVQIGDENVHRVRALMDEVFGEENFCSQISFRTTGAQTSGLIPQQSDFLLWFAKDRSQIRYRAILEQDTTGSWDPSQDLWIEENYIRRRLKNNEKALLQRIGSTVFRHRTVEPKSGSASTTFCLNFEGRVFNPKSGKGWSTHTLGMQRLSQSNRIMVLGNSVRYPIFFGDYGYTQVKSDWPDTMVSGFSESKQYVVQTATKVIQRCILMTTDPGDLVLDPTCGSGTTAYVAEQWGRRWITIDTSRVALALARSRLMGARYPWYLLADSPEGQMKEAEVSRNPPRTAATRGNVALGFVYERVPHVTLKSIANNTEIDDIWERWQPAVTGALAELNSVLQSHGVVYRVPAGGREGQTVDCRRTDGETIKLPSGEDAPANALLDWEVPREAPADWPDTTPEPLKAYWAARIAHP